MRPGITVVVSPLISLMRDQVGQLREYGYDLADGEVFDDDLAVVLRAFQRHFRPALVDGVADRSTMVTLDRLIAALPHQS